jgi:hypothetical protein
MTNLQELVSESFLTEIHHLLWTKKFKNKGKLDLGWHCRDHALILDALAKLLGHESIVHHGRLMMSTGPHKQDRPYGNEVEHHTWTFIEGLGLVDLSLRVPRDQFPTWRDWQISAVFGNKVIPQDGTSVFLLDTPQGYDRAVAISTHAASERRLIYHRIREEPFDLINLNQASGWVHSPLSDELEDNFRLGSTIYRGAIFHLHELLHGRRASLTTLSHYNAWKTIAEIPEETLSDLLRPGS